MKRFTWHCGNRQRHDAQTETELTIEQLAQETGMTVRNIRNHQSRGLLPPPEVRARTATTAPSTSTRLRLIQEMQAEGFNLGRDQAPGGRAEGAADRLLGFKRAGDRRRSRPSRRRCSTVDELAERFGAVDAEAAASGRAQARRCCVPVGDGRFEAPSPTLLRAAEEVDARAASRCPRRWR